MLNYILINKKIPARQDKIKHNPICVRISNLLPYLLYTSCS